MPEVRHIVGTVVLLERPQSIPTFQINLELSKDITQNWLAILSIRKLPEKHIFPVTVFDKAALSHCPIDDSIELINGLEERLYHYYYLHKSTQI